MSRHRAMLPPRGALIPALAILVLLGLFIGADPSPGVTASASPFADESWNTIGAHNLVLLGRWSTDQWNLYLIQLPFSVLLAGVFAVLGPGIVQARLACVVAVALTTLALGWGLRRPFGAEAATIAAIGFATSTLVLFYGRLVYLEDLQVLLLTLGTLTLVPTLEGHAFRWGLVGGALLALGIGTKANGVLAAAGVLAAVAMLAAIRRAGPWRADPRLRWVSGAFLALVVAGLLWAALIALPDRHEIALDLAILPRLGLPATVGRLLRLVSGVFTADHALLLSAPLVGAGTLGALIALADPLGRRAGHLDLVAAAIGWVVVAGAALAIVAYRPNRYFVPLLPAFAILLAAGVSTIVARLGTRAHRPIVTNKGDQARATLAPRPAAAGLVLVVVLAGPGLSAYVGWMREATYRLPTIQHDAAKVVPAGAVAVGPDAPAFLMSAPVAVVVPLATQGVNTGDLYTTMGARWFIIGQGSASSPVAEDHPGPWAARRAAYCAYWYDETLCLYEVP